MPSNLPDACLHLSSSLDCGRYPADFSRHLFSETPLQATTGFQPAPLANASGITRRGQACGKTTMAPCLLSGTHHSSPSRSRGNRPALAGTPHHPPSHCGTGRLPIHAGRS